MKGLPKSGEQNTSKNMNFLNQYRGLPKEIYYLCVVRLIADIGLIFIMPYISVICTQHLGYTTIQAGYIMALQSVGNIAGSLLGGKLADTIGRRKTVLGMLFAVIVIEVIAGLTSGSRILLLFMMLGFFANAAMIPASMAVMVDVTDDTNRNTAISLLFIFSNIGVAVGPILGGALFYSHMDWSFYMISVFFAAAFVLMYAKIPEMNPRFIEAKLTKPSAVAAEYSCSAGEGSESIGERRTDDETNESPIGDIEHKNQTSEATETLDSEANQSLLTVVLHRPVLALFVFGLFVGAFAYTEISYLCPIQYNDMVGLEQSAKFVTLIWSGSGIIVILFTPLIMRFIRRHTHITNVAIGSALYGIGFTLFAVRPAYLPILASTFIWTVGSVMINTEGNVFIADQSPPSHSGRSMSLFEFARSAAKLTSPVSCSYLLLYVGYEEVWLILSVICLLVSGLFLLLRRRETRGSRKNP